MAAKTKAVVVVGVLFLALIAGLLLTSPRSPEYGGKTLDDWLVLLDPHVDRAADHAKASEALTHMGAAAMPRLSRILRSRRDSITQRVRDRAVRWRIMKPPKLTFQEQQFRAARAAYHLAEDADVNISSLVPDLRHHLTNSSYGDSEAARALARAGWDGISCLTNLLATGEQRVRDQAGWALALDRKVRSQPGAQDALIQAANSDPDARNRANAVLYLASFREGGATNRLVPLGLRFLSSKDGYQRWVGAKLLVNYRSVPEVEAALHAAVSDPDERVRSVIEGAMRQTPTATGQR